MAISVTKAGDWPYSKRSAGKINALRTPVVPEGERMFIFLLL